jgi:D-serine deaminase-like pyridoxal phosphate-dependent protein
MADKVKLAGCEFRPHFKTHQSRHIGNWFRDEGVSGITVSSPEMGLYFAADNWNDMTIAFPFYPGMIPRLQKLEKQSYLRLFINQVKDIELLERDLQNPFSVYIETDAGYGRSGIPYSDYSAIDSLINRISRSHLANFHGFYIHDGRTYSARSVAEVKMIAEPSMAALLKLKEKYPKSKVSLGDTPTASILDSFEGMDEITAGNFVFYDWTQCQIGSCTIDDVALFVHLPVAQVIESGNRAILHGGAVHLSKETIRFGENQSYGQAVIRSESQTGILSDVYISALSQEHGTLTGYQYTNSAQSVLICPVHSCLTANLFADYTTFTGSRIEKRILS